MGERALRSVKNAATPTSLGLKSDFDTPGRLFVAEILDRRPLWVVIVSKQVKRYQTPRESSHRPCMLLHSAPNFSKRQFYRRYRRNGQSPGLCAHEV